MYEARVSPLDSVILPKSIQALVNLYLGIVLRFGELERITGPFTEQPLALLPGEDLGTDGGYVGWRGGRPDQDAVVVNAVG